MVSDIYIEHIEKCDKCISRQEVIDLLHDYHEKCLQEKGLIRNNIFLLQDNCAVCKIISEIIDKLQHEQVECCDNSYACMGDMRREEYNENR